MVVCGHRGVFPIVGRERARPPLLSKRHGRPQRRHPPRTRGGIPADRDRGVRVRRWGDCAPLWVGRASMVQCSRLGGTIASSESNGAGGSARRVGCRLRCGSRRIPRPCTPRSFERLTLTIRQGSAYVRRRSPGHARGADQLHGHIDRLRCSYNVIRPHRALKCGRENPDASDARRLGERANALERHLHGAGRALRIPCGGRTRSRCRPAHAH